MHPSILAQRRAQAVNRIVQAARILDPEHAEALEPKGIKDPQAVEMIRLEALADLLERLGPVFEAPAALAPEPIQDPTVTAVTPAPMEDPRPTLDDFPVHVVESPPAEEEDDGFEAKPKRRSTAKRTKKSS